MAPRKKRRSKLDPYLNQVGKVPDRDIAEKAGVSPDAVRMFRQRHKIPSHRNYLKTHGTPKAAPASAAPKRAVKAVGGQRAFLLTLKSAKKESEWVILANDIVDAASQAEASGRGDVVSLRFLGDVLS